MQDDSTPRYLDAWAVVVAMLGSIVPTSGAFAPGEPVLSTKLCERETSRIPSLFEPWVRFVVGDRKEIVVALDWTEFDKDGHATLCMYLLTRHGRATEWLGASGRAKTLKGARVTEDTTEVGAVDHQAPHALALQSRMLLVRGHPRHARGALPGSHDGLR